MAKLPGWMVIEVPKRGYLSADRTSVEFNVRVRKWHPGFWWAVFQMLVLGRDPLTRKVDR